MATPPTGPALSYDPPPNELVSQSNHHSMKTIVLKLNRINDLLPHCAYIFKDDHVFSVLPDRILLVLDFLRNAMHCPMILFRSFLRWTSSCYDEMHKRR